VINIEEKIPVRNVLRTFAAIDNMTRGGWGGKRWLDECLGFGPIVTFLFRPKAFVTGGGRGDLLVWLMTT
jgi:hypothetical protein